jgi:hypothetical protein
VQADPGSPGITSIFEAAAAAQPCYHAAFDAWTVARGHIYQAWMHNADPANLSRPVPKVMRRVLESVHLLLERDGTRCDELRLWPLTPPPEHLGVTQR